MFTTALALIIPTSSPISDHLGYNLDSVTTSICVNDNNMSSHIYMQSQFTHARMHKHTHACTHTHTHARTHTHTPCGEPPRHSLLCWRWHRRQCRPELSWAGHHTHSETVGEKVTEVCANRIHYTCTLKTHPNTSNTLYRRTSL